MLSHENIERRYNTSTPSTRQKITLTSISEERSEKKLLYISLAKEVDLKLPINALYTNYRFSSMKV